MVLECNWLKDYGQARGQVDNTASDPEHFRVVQCTGKMFYDIQFPLSVKYFLAL